MRIRLILGCGLILLVNMRLLFVFLTLGMCLVSSAVEIVQDSENPWSIDQDTLCNDVPCLRTSSISNETSTSITLIFKDVSSVEFCIRTSTEGGCDRLIIEFEDGNTYEYSGENDYWDSLYYDWGWDGEHIVTLTYQKDGSVSAGEDCCWICFEGGRYIKSWW